ncbi:MAG: elongation factor P hydroxylase [Halioglobus sp.]
MRFNTVLQGGYDEPVYQPPGESGEQALVGYRADYFASALHEAAHWCIAGEARRRCIDYDYWYAPDGRDNKQQQAFESAESKPQALEWCFAIACGYYFKISPDNLDLLTGHIRDSSQFKQSIVDKAHHWKLYGLPQRAEQYFTALAREFVITDSSGKPLSITAVEFDLGDLIG